MTLQQKPPLEMAKSKIRNLSFIEPRDTARLLKARLPRPVMKSLRLILPTLAILVIAALIIWPIVNPDKLRTIIMNNIPDLVVKDLRFTGRDANNQPYSLNAEKATRPGGAQNIFDLDQPKGEITLNTGALLSGTALTGRFDQDTKQLALGGNVQLFHDDGYQFTSDEAQIDLKSYNAAGNKPVTITGDFGVIKGAGFRLYDSGNVMIVNGPAKATLNLRDTPPSDKPEAGKATPKRKD